MSELIYRLQHSGSLTPNLVTLLHEAATEIERLQAENEQLVTWERTSHAYVERDKALAELAEIRHVCLWTPDKEERDGTHGSGDTRDAERRN